MTSRFAARTAAVAAVAGLALAIAPAAAHAEDATAPAAQQGEINFGSVFDAFDMEALGGSLTNSVMDSNPSEGSLGSLMGTVNTDSLQFGLNNALGSTSGSAGSIGEIAGVLNADEGGFADVVGGSIESASSGPSSTETLDGDNVKGSIANFFGAIKAGTTK